MKKQTGRREARSGSSDDKRSFDKPRGTRDSKRSPRDEKRKPYDKDAGPKQFKKYADASKSEAGWTKPDGKPMRRRTSKDEPDAERSTGKRSYGERSERPERKSFGERPERGERKSYGDKPERKSFGERSERPERKSFGERPERGERKSYGDKPERKSFGERSERPERKSFGERPERGERKSYGDKPERKSFGERSERPERKSFGERPERGERKSYGDKPERKSFGERSERPERKSFGERPERGERKEYGDKPERKSFGERSERPERKTFGERPKDEGDTNDFIKSGRGNINRGPRVRSEEGGEERSSRFSDRSDRGERSSRGFSGDKSTQGRFSREERTFNKKDKGRPEKNKSYRKSSAEDARPFGRFAEKPSRDSRRKDTGLPSKPRVKSKPQENVPEGAIRLNRFIANAGICSRREADEYITAGLVTVNGEIVTELGVKVSVNDDVRYNGERLKAEKNVYVLLNKPKDYITTSDDPDGRKTVMELIAKACKERVYPVGRLDRNTTGVLLFTNDGDLAKKLTHPSTMVRKIYHVELDKTLKKNDFEKMITGIDLEDGVSMVDEISYDSGGDKSMVGVELHSGKNRIVRRMFEALGYEIKKLDRVMFAGLTKKDLPRGRWRLLTEIEVGMLKMQTGKPTKSKPKKEKVDKDSQDQLTLF